MKLPCTKGIKLVGFWCGCCPNELGFIPVCDEIAKGVGDGLTSRWGVNTVWRSCKMCSTRIKSRVWHEKLRNLVYLARIVCSYSISTLIATNRHEFSPTLLGDFLSVIKLLSSDFQFDNDDELSDDVFHVKQFDIQMRRYLNRSLIFNHHTLNYF